MGIFKWKKNEGDKVARNYLDYYNLCLLFLEFEKPVMVRGFPNLKKKYIYMQSMK